MLSIRPAVRSDAVLLNSLIHEFADFYKFPVSISEEQLLSDGFGPEPRFQALIAEFSGQPAGYALFFDYYASFHGGAIFLEDLFVRTQFRGTGAGKALLARVAATGVERGCRRIMLNVLSSNDPAVGFYRKLGAGFLDDWKVVCFEGNSFGALLTSDRATTAD
jgi:GNAT superfamily N-acetyltransferase